MNDHQRDIPVRAIPAIYERVSTRAFLAEPIAKDVIREILTAGTMAPSSGNMQPWEFIVLDDEASKREVVQHTFSGYFSKGTAYQSWIQNAGVVIVVCANLKRTIARYGPAGRDWALLDVAAAVQNMLLTATALGLAGCWVGGFQEEAVKQQLHIPDCVKPVGLLPMGYPAAKPRAKGRISLDWVTHSGRYNTPYFAHGFRNERQE